VRSSVPTTPPPLARPPTHPPHTHPHACRPRLYTHVSAGERPVGRGLADVLGLLNDKGALKDTVEWAGRNNDKKPVALIVSVTTWPRRVSGLSQKSSWRFLVFTSAWLGDEASARGRVGFLARSTRLRAEPLAVPFPHRQPPSNRQPPNRHATNQPTANRRAWTRCTRAGGTRTDWLVPWRRR
jgi:hypothetical protein